MLAKEIKEKSKDVFGDMISSRISECNKVKEQSKLND
jgi:hypothetical protein